MELKQAFGNVAYACNECLLSKDQRDAVTQSLQILVSELNSYDMLKKQVKEIEKPDKNAKKDGVKAYRPETPTEEPGVKKANSEDNAADD